MCYIQSFLDQYFLIKCDFLVLNCLVIFTIQIYFWVTIMANNVLMWCYLLSQQSLNKDQWKTTKYITKDLFTYIQSWPSWYFRYVFKRIIFLNTSARLLQCPLEGLKKTIFFFLATMTNNYLERTARTSHA